MANVTTFNTFAALSAYLPEGAWPAVEYIKRTLPNDIIASDALALYSSATLNAAEEVHDTAGKRPVLVVIQSRGAKGYLALYNTDADTVTQGTVMHALFPFGATTGECAVYAITGASNKTFWDTGLTASVATTATGTAAPSTLPVVFILYA